MGGIDPIWLVGGLALLLGLGLIIALARGGRGSADASASLQVETMQRVAEQLQAQERALRDTLEQRLDALQAGLGQKLDQGSQNTAKTIADVRERLGRIDEAQKALGQLSTQVVGLQEILSNKQARGAFGEQQLNDIVSNMLPSNAYSFQTPLSNGSRVDCLLSLPNPPGPIAIDAKFPLEAWRALRAAGDDAQRELAIRAFRLALRKHIGDIRDKYIIPGETAETALMFLPSEAVFAELHENFIDIVEESQRARVAIVSPATMMATLNTVRAILKDVKMRQQAHQIQIEVAALMKDVDRLTERTEKLRNHFGQATKDIDDVLISAGKIASRGEKIKDVELEDKSALPSG